ncbi:MAG: VWA domain-containing protein, partial [Bacteroidetes bacterium]|nr:VWA domain-containing protein [Bacteroidota bacterium]
MTMKYTIIILAISLVISGKAQEISADKSASPYFLILNDYDQKPLLPLQSTEAAINIAGVIAGVTVKQTYENQGDVPIEAIYIFPASTRAAVYNMKMTIGERTIEAVVQEKDEARATYKQALEEGKTASLLEQQRPNIFQMQVGNIMPGDIIEVTLSYTELLIPENGTYEFVYPTVTGPRYSNGKEQEQDNSWINNPYTTENVKPGYTFDLKATINAGVPLQSIRSVTHHVDISYQGEKSASVSLTSDEAFSGNKDFILEYQLAGNRIETGNLFYEGEKENYFLTMLQPPQRVDAKTRTPREYIFVVDVSGSMAGFPLSISKKIMNALFSSLTPGDKFNIVTFAGASEELFPESVSATEGNIAQARQFMDSRHGGGGTELLPAMEKALNYKNRNDDYARTFVILTDGYVSVEKQTFNLIREKINRANFFAFGIGSSVNRFLIEGIAHAGKGHPFVATNIKEADKQADKFINYVSNPVLTNISMLFNGFDTYETEPQNIPDLFAERPIIVFGKYKGKPTGTITIEGSSAGGKYGKTIRLNQEKAVDENAALPYLWAREKIRTMADFNAVDNNE